MLTLNGHQPGGRLYGRGDEGLLNGATLRSAHGNVADDEGERDGKYPDPQNRR